MQMSRRQWRTLDLVERIERGELTVGEAALALGRSRRCTSAATCARS
jgi:hypothetical protein